MDGDDAQFGAVTVGGSDGDAAEVVTLGAGVERRQVEDDEQQGEDDRDTDQRHDDADLSKPVGVLVVSVVADERHQSEAERQTEHCPDKDCVVVDHRHEQPDDEQKDEEDDQADARPPPVVVTTTVYQRLEEERGKDAGLRASRTNLQPIVIGSKSNNASVGEFVWPGSWLTAGGQTGGRPSQNRARYFGLLRLTHFSPEFQNGESEKGI